MVKMESGWDARDMGRDTVDVICHERVVLYSHNGRPLRRAVGFSKERAMQTSGTFPELTRKPTKKGGKKR